MLVCYLPAARCYLFALGRGSDIIVGELREGYFDYVTDTMSGDGKYGFIVNNKNGDVLISSEKGKCGTNITGQTVYAENFAACTVGDALITGDMFTDFVVYSGSLPQNSEFGVIYQVDSDMIYGKGKRAILIMAVLTAVMIILVTIVSTLFARRISASIAPTVECLEKFSEGTIDTSFRANNRGDETELLSRAMETTIKNVGEYIRDIDFILSEISRGDLTAQSSCEYKGDFNNIRQSLDHISSSLRSTISVIRRAGVQVNNGASSLADGAQTLAQNSNSEAVTLRELEDLMHGINSNVTDNACIMSCMRTLSDKAVKKVEAGNRSMAELSDAIEDIRAASQEIQSIAKLIDGIAFQTNILALNAAVEAARAGSAGKGFAVVADEVINLAGKSAEAARSAVTLIERSTEAAERGVELNESVCSTLEDVRSSMTELGLLVTKAADSTDIQVRDISTVNAGLSSITDAVKSNAAAAEESAAGSEELAGQAEILEKRLGNFRI